MEKKYASDGEARAAAERIVRKDLARRDLTKRVSKVFTPTPDSLHDETMGKIPRYWVCGVDFSPPGRFDRDKVAGGV